MKPANPPRKTDVVTAINAHGLALYATSDASLNRHGYVVAKRYILELTQTVPNAAREINYVVTGKRDWTL